MEKYRFQSKNKEDLLEKALHELNVKREDVLIKFYEEKGGLFTSKKYILEVVKLVDIAETGKDIILELLQALNIKANIETKVREGKIKYELFSKNNSLLIGKKGHVLDSIQVYVRQSIYTMLDLHVDISIDVEKYKEKQAYFLEKNAKRVARDVTLSKIDVKLDPMSAYERKIVHNALQNFKYIKTESEGEEPNRCVVVKYVEKKVKVD